MADSNSFTCPKGHEFNAVAKLRARCPKCGLMARREFGSTNETSSAAKKVLKSFSSTSRKEVRPKTSVSGLRHHLTTKKENLSSSETKESEELAESSQVTPKPEVIKRGRITEVPRKAVTHKPAPKKIVASTRSIVQHKVASKSAGHPKVNKMPRGSRERKVEEVVGDTKSYWERVKETYFR